METKDFYVYRHLKNDSASPIYIGMAQKIEDYNSIETEFKRGYELTHNRSDVWFRAFEKHGGFTVEIVADELTKAEAIAKEIELIALYGRYKYGGPLCNLTDGGEGVWGLEHSDESKAKMSHSAKNRKKQRSVESRQAQSKNQKDANSKPVICVDSGKIYKNCHEATEDLFPNSGRYTPDLITKGCVTGRRYKGFLFRRLNDNNEPIIVAPQPKKLNGKLTPHIRSKITEFHYQGFNHSEIALIFDISSMTVFRYLNGHTWNGEGKSTKPKKETKQPVDLNEKLVIEIKEAMLAGHSNRELAEEYNADMSCLQRIKSGETWKDIGPDVTKLPKRKLTLDIAIAIKKRLREVGSTYVSREFGVVRSTIERIRDGKIWKEAVIDV